MLRSVLVAFEAVDGVMFFFILDEEVMFILYVATERLVLSLILVYLWKFKLQTYSVNELVVQLLLYTFLIKLLGGLGL